MTTFISKFIAKVIGPKQGWREYKARARQLPASYRTALDAFERYLNYLGGAGDGGAILGDLLDLFERGAADGTPIRQIVGEDPVAFIEAFIQNYPEGHWRAKGREGFISAIETIERQKEQR
jgi:DNA-binding ferritin-like protein (Dps family)